MSKDLQEILDVLAYNRKESEQLQAHTKQVTETFSDIAKQSVDASNQSAAKADEAIQHSMRLLAKRGISVNLPEMIREESRVPQSPHIHSKRDWSELLTEARAAGFEQTVLEDLLTPQEMSEADDEYIRVKAAFSENTRLTKMDISLLLLTVALQCARQYIFANDKFRFRTAKEADEKIKASLKHATPTHWQDILFGPVPYDAVSRLDPMSDSTGLSAKTHRYRTLGHDPVLGWVFGPINILSNSLTKTDIVTTYEIHGGKIGPFYKGGTLGATEMAIEKAQENKYNLPAAIIKQAIHFGSDYFTKQGLPLPFVSSLDNDLAQKLVQRYSIDSYSVTRGATIAAFINTLITIIHKLFYDEKKHGSQELYEVRTRKLLMIANAIATSSNVIYVALSKDAKKLDIGGMLVTIYRIISDLSFIKKIQQEFMFEQYDQSLSKELQWVSHVSMRQDISE
ncbi:hypothetical protein [Metabacillus iocasae]|uniref:Uncharacterized protein n=1 Tax=Priestia iocasae TaxID=2291674 RepID=A0ABS2QTW2_9BACI|nr:hypothetical protein [Metabacillus iocasae]MBM7702910.1 hypothetical protein [Metabacillus iocasae]